MKSCPITLEWMDEDRMFSEAGLRALHPQLKHLDPLPLTGEEQIREARLRADKMSVQGVQPKLSAVLKPKEGRFEIVEHDVGFGKRDRGKRAATAGQKTQTDTP